MKLSAWRAAVRIARRDAMRAKGRSALVLAMIALPVLGVAGADVVVRSAQLEPSETVARTMGTADAEITVAALGGTVLQTPDAGESLTRQVAKGHQPTPEQQRSAATDPAQLLTDLLPGAVLVPERSSIRTTTTTREGRMSVAATEIDLTDPVWHGKVNVVRGTAPTRPNEIAASQAFLDRSGLRIGDTTALRKLDATPYTITGVAERPNQLTEVELVARPGALLAPLAAADPLVADQSDHRPSWLVTLPAGSAVDWPKVLELNRYGFQAVAEAVLLHPPARAEVPYYAEQQSYGFGPDKVAVAVAATVVGMALLEIVLLAGPAFAVGARRSRRQLGLLAAGGGDRSHVRSVVLAGGAVLGAAGAVLGTALAIALVAVFRTDAEAFARRRFGHLDLHALDLLAIGLVGLTTGLLAAVVPAVQASRQDVVEALTGRGGARPASRIVAAVGSVMVVGGAALALLCAATDTMPSLGLLGGSVIAEIGMLLCTPLLIGLFGRLGRHLPLSPRLALRDAVRQRGRTAPAVAAVMAPVAGAVAVGIYGASDVEQQRRDYRPSLPPGAVALHAGWGPTADPGRLPVLRDAVTADVRGLGERADVAAPTAVTGECTDGYLCGYVQPVLPPETRCPADTMDDIEERRKASADPRCAAEARLSDYSTSLFGDAVVGDAAVLHNLLGVHDPAAEQALAAGKALVFRPGYVSGGKLNLEIGDPPTKAERDSHEYENRTRTITADAVEVHSDAPFATTLMSRQAAERAGLGVRPTGSLWAPGTAPADGPVQKATARIAKLDDNAMLSVEAGFAPDRDVVTIGLTVFAALVALGAAGIATGLAAADSQQDLATLAAVGASGGIRRRLSGFQCGVIAAMGTVLGTFCGAVPALALRLLQARNTTVWVDNVIVGHQKAIIAIPWGSLAALLIGLPAVAVLLAAGLTRSRIGLTRRAG